jgi:hypothetical protein
VRIRAATKAKNNKDLGAYRYDDAEEGQVQKAAAGTPRR